MSEQKKWIAGFWRRIGALFIDSIVLGLVGLSLGLFLEEYFIQVGSWGRVIGFSIALVYFGIMNSHLANGQTIGKKILKLKVVTADNQAISLVTSLGRYSILGIPFFMNNAQFPIEAFSSFWLYLLSLVILGGLLTISYLYVFNRATRQSLHDLIFNTYVVNMNVDSENLNPVWKPHLYIAGFILFAAAIAPVFTYGLIQQEPFVTILKGQQSLQENSIVNYSSVSYGKSLGANAESTYVSTQVFLNKNNISDTTLAREFANVLLVNDSTIRQKDIIVVNLIYGYDIGISSWWSTYSHRFKPSELN